MAKEIEIRITEEDLSWLLAAVSEMGVRLRKEGTAYGAKRMGDLLAKIVPQTAKVLEEDSGESVSEAVLTLRG